MVESLLAFVSEGRLRFEDFVKILIFQLGEDEGIWLRSKLFTYFIVCDFIVSGTYVMVRTVLLG